MTTEERLRLIDALQGYGWTLRDGTIYAPSNGLWFDESHFEQWTPQEMHEIFLQRAERIERGQIGDWEMSARENHQVHWALESILEHEENRD